MYIIFNRTTNFSTSISSYGAMSMEHEWWEIFKVINKFYDKQSEVISVVYNMTQIMANACVWMWVGA